MEQHKFEISDFGTTERDKSIEKIRTLDFGEKW